MKAEDFYVQGRRGWVRLHEKGGKEHEMPTHHNLDLRPILQGVDFAASAADDPLIEAIQFLKQASSEGKALGTYKENLLPVRWIPEKMKRYIYSRDKDTVPSTRQATPSISYCGRIATRPRHAGSSNRRLSGTTHQRKLLSIRVAQT